MGIQGLNNFLRKRTPRIFSQENISKFYEKRIAIDIPIVVMKHFSIQWKKYITTKINAVTDEVDEDAIIKLTISAVKRELNRLKKIYKLVLILVFEGQSSIEKKQNAGIRRATARQNARNILDMELKNISEGFDPITDEDIQKYEKICKLRARCAVLPTYLYSELEKSLERDNYCILRANTEAEELCTELCIQEKVDAVYSTDTDCIVRRCPTIITKIDENGLANITTYNETLLTGLDITHEQFIDVAILTECDYNSGIPKVGIVRSYNFIKKYGSLEAFEKEETKYDVDTISKLNYNKCRTLLKNQSLDALCDNLIPLEELVILPPENINIFLS